MIPQGAAALFLASGAVAQATFTRDVMMPKRYEAVPAMLILEPPADGVSDAGRQMSVLLEEYLEEG